VRKIKIADAIIAQPHLRHTKMREIYRTAIRTENNRRKFWRRKKAEANVENSANS
jgi:hypothetical protein